MKTLSLIVAAHEVVERSRLVQRVLQGLPLDGRRPLAADRIEMERLYNQRLMAYGEAHLRLDAGRSSVEELVDQIVDWLGA